MTDATQQTGDDKSKKKFRNWYENNRDDYNAKRRERYAKNKDLREKARANARKQRAKGGDVEVEPVLRKVSGRTIPVWRVGAAAQMIGRSPETIRTWIKNGWVPDVDDGWTHRTFTKGQIKLLQRLSNCIEKHRYAQDYQQQLAKTVESIRKQW
jgi:hypothetical protein